MAEVSYKTMGVVVAAVMAASGGAGTWAGGARAQQELIELEHRVDGIAENQAAIITDLGHIKNNQEKLTEAAQKGAEAANERDKKLTKILTILEERED